MANVVVVSRILNSLRDIFAEPKGFVVAELGDGFIKCVETRLVKGKPDPVRLVKKPVDTKNAIEAVPALKKIFEGFDRSRRRVRLNIPRHLLTVRFLKLPSTDEVEIGKMVKMESLKYVPYADERIVAGYRIVEKLESGYSGVMIAVTKAENVESSMDLFRRAGVTVESVSLGSEALLLWYLSAGMGKDPQTVLLLNMDADHIDIDVVCQDKLLFTRGVHHGEAGEIATEKIAQEIRLSTAARQKESGKPVDKILLIGPSGRTRPLKEAIKDQFVIPVNEEDPMGLVMKGQTVPVEIASCSFAELIGLSTLAGQAKINLLSESAQKANRFEALKQQAIVSLTLLMLIALAIGGLVFKKISDERVELGRINAEVRKLEPRLKSLKKIAKQIELISAYKARRPLAADLLSEVYKMTPQGIVLSLVECEIDKTLTLRGTASSMSDVFRYTAALQQSPYFDNVKVKYANKRAGQGSELADFEILSSVIQPAQKMNEANGDKAIKQ